MNISPFFLELRTAYQAEMDDLTFDSEGRDVLRQRLIEKRQELAFLLRMMEISPEMVAVIFHKGFRFKLPAVMDHVISHEADELPAWETVADAIQMTPWAQDLAEVIMGEPMGEWFLAVAAGLEYMYGKHDTARPTQAADEDGDEREEGDELEDEEEKEAREREEAGADWMVEQGFDRKD